MFVYQYQLSVTNIKSLEKLPKMMTRRMTNMGAKITTTNPLVSLPVEIFSNIQPYGKVIGLFVGPEFPKALPETLNEVSLSVPE